MRRSALVICNGEPPGKQLARKLADAADIVVAADGGANVARRVGIRPDVIIGDLDSLLPTTKKLFSGATFIQVTRQDNTDLEKALDYLVQNSIGRVSIIAATGKRLDHTLGNLSIIWKYTSSFEISIIGDDWVAAPVGKKLKMRGSAGMTVSLLPYGRCSGVTLRGLQYPLTDATMNVGEIGVSNVVRNSPFSVEVKKGRMLIILLGSCDSFEIVRRW